MDSEVEQFVAWNDPVRTLSFHARGNFNRVIGIEVEAVALLDERTQTGCAEGPQGRPMPEPLEDRFTTSPQPPQPHVPLRLRAAVGRR